MINVWEKFFNNQAKGYHKEPWTVGTIHEVDFIEEHLSLQKSMNILDVGCGTGRHSLEMARRGYNITGIDIADKMLDEARKIAKAEGLSVEFIQADATKFAFDKDFDAAICLCEGAFGLLDVTEEPFLRDLKIIRNICNCLKQNGLFLLTCASALPHIRRWNDDDVRNGIYDLENFVETFKMDDMYPEEAKDLVFKSKSFTPTELKMLFYMAGLETVFIGGGTAGAWNKEFLSINDHEILILGSKR